MLIHVPIQDLSILIIGIADLALTVVVAEKEAVCLVPALAAQVGLPDLNRVLGRLNQRPSGRNI